MAESRNPLSYKPRRRKLRYSVWIGSIEDKDGHFITLPLTAGKCKKNDRLVFSFSL